ncbi:MAG: hypothetical protein IJK78_14880 [Bacteroidales bacterium]|nr:hypothetical protein [Bacteroidales bacterium]MBQ6307837.1 hypothetical protein [Bacteroidales bacterium]
MKKSFIVFATIAIAIFAATAVSCKKDKQEEPTNNERVGLNTNTFTPPQVEDMNAYLKDFKEKMQTSKEDETMGLAEAAWHLSGVANYDFCNANVEYTDIRFDTLFSHVEVSGGKVTLLDMGKTYKEIWGKVDSFYHGLDLEGKHFRFIDVIIAKDGTVVIPIVTTFNKSSKWVDDTLWYFQFVNDPVYLLELELDFFGDTTYYSNSTAIVTLNRLLNLLQGRPTTASGAARYYYTVTRSKTFLYTQYIDPKGSLFHNESRLFTNDGVQECPLDREIMLYLLDSYLGLGLGGRNPGEETVTWNVVFNSERTQEFYHHSLDVQYGFIIQGTNPIDY